MNLLFRTDASVKMGTGHVMRCLALAQAVQDAGGRAVFAMTARTPAIEGRLSAESCTVLPVSCAAGSSEDAQQTLSLARQEQADAMNSRDAILASIRRSLAATGAEAPRRLEVETRLAAAPAGVIPARGQGDLAARVATFKAEAERAQASVAEVASLDELPAEVARYLRANNLPATLRVGADPTLAAAPWGATAIEILHGASDGRDLNAASHAFAAVAETGTLALVSGAHNPTTLNFLPDNHVVVVSRDRIDADYESVFARLREGYGKGQAPRTLNFVTGPSRSADIEQTLLLGAHGPRRLHVVVARRG